MTRRPTKFTKRTKKTSTVSRPSVLSASRPVASVSKPKPKPKPQPVKETAPIKPVVSVKPKPSRPTKPSKPVAATPSKPAVVKPSATIKPGTIKPGVITPGVVQPGIIKPGTIKPGSRPIKPGGTIKPTPGGTIKPVPGGIKPIPGGIFQPGGPGTVIPGDIFDPGVIGPLLKNSADPLLLMPMRLEYRVVKKRSKLEVLDDFSLLDQIKSATGAIKGNSKSAVLARNKKTADLRIKAGTTPPKFKPVIQREDHILVRWFPDSNFAEDGVEPITDEEVIALNTFLTADARRVWPDLRDDGVNESWQTFVSEVGLSRAIHLMRSQGKPGDPDWEARVGRIMALPRYVKLYGIKDGQLFRPATVTEIVQGADIPANKASEASAVSYAPDRLADADWLTNFQAAINVGMGIRITDQKMVKVALESDWIVAIGVHPGRASDEIEAFLQDQIANGEMEFLKQDQPTNNSPSGVTSYQSKSTDIAGDTKRATAAESGRTQNGGAAALLSDALGIKADVLSKAMDADDTAFADAQAMMRVIGPALLDAAIDDKSLLPGVTETEFLDVMAAAVTARGALSPMRFGDNPYGVATITDLSEMDRHADSDLAKRKVEAFMMNHATGLISFYPPLANAQVPVIEPDDPAASGKLEEILKINRVSTRLEVGDAGSDSTRTIGCPYVTGRSAIHRPKSYLERLRTNSLEKLPDPKATDRNWPLLYRLARQTLTRNTTFQLVKPHIKERGELKTGTLELKGAAVKKVSPAIKDIGKFSIQSLGTIRNGSLSGVSTQTLTLIRKANRAFSDALHYLRTVSARKDGTAQLEMLMLEVFDLFQHRIDAWATGLAYSRLLEIRGESRTHDVSAGWYGIMGKLRSTSATAKNDGYIQAPTIAHATSAAVMRSAYLRHREDGAFAINLRSARAQRALKLLEMLRKGLTLNEALGLRGERWLRDNKGAGEVLDLRKKFPLRAADRSKTPQRVFDGLAVATGSTSGMNAKQQQLRAALGEDLDAVSDLVMAEAVHLRTMGAAEAAAAWLDVLSGGPVPGRPSVLRTQRYGHGSDYRVSLLLPNNVDARSNEAPRTMIEGGFAAMAEAVLTNYDRAFIEVNAALADDPGTSVTHKFLLERDLGMKAMDFVIGGMSEVKTRAAHKARRMWIEGVKPFANLGMLPASGTALAFKTQVLWQLNTKDLEAGDLSANAERLRRIGQRARPIDAGDLNVAAKIDAPLDEAKHAGIVANAVSELNTRTKTVLGLIDKGLADLTNVRTAFMSSAFNILAQLSDGDADSIANAAGQLLGLWSALQDALWNVAGYGLPQVLRLQSAGDMLTDVQEVEASLIAVEEQLVAKGKALNEAQAAAATAAADSVAEQRGAMALLVAALKAATDGEAQPVAPIYTRNTETTPLLEAGKTVASELGEFARVRGAVRGITDLVSPLRHWKAFPVSERAIEPDDTDDQFKLTEQAEPLARHFGYWISKNPRPASQLSFSGFIVDDWTEQRPSETQDAAIAVNYDTPQSEAPNCLLLCVPPKTGPYSWTDERVAGMVKEAIDLMRVRAMSTHDHLINPTLRPGMNQVSYAGSGSKQTARIPKSTFAFVKGHAGKFDAGFVTASAATKVPKSAKLATQNYTGFTRIKE